MMLPLLVFAVPTVVSTLIDADVLRVSSHHPELKGCLVLDFGNPGSLESETIAAALASNATRFGTGWVGESGKPILTVTIQFGTTLIICLLDPSDPATWEMRAGWTRSGTVCLAIHTNTDTAVFAFDASLIPPEFEGLFQPSTSARGESFVKHAAREVLSRDLIHTATSGVKAIPSLENVYLYVTLTPRHRALLANAPFSVEAADASALH